MPSLRDNFGRTNPTHPAACFWPAADRSDVSVSIRSTDPPSRLCVWDVDREAGTGVTGVVPDHFVWRIGGKKEFCGCSHGVGQNGDRVHDRSVRQENAAVVSRLADGRQRRVSFVDRHALQPRHSPSNAVLPSFSVHAQRRRPTERVSDDGADADQSGSPKPKIAADGLDSGPCSNSAGWISDGRPDRRGGDDGV